MQKNIVPQYRLSSSLICFAIVCLFAVVPTLGYSQTELQFVSGFNVPDAEDVAFLPATGNLAVINSNVGGSGLTGVEIYTTSGTLLETLPFSMTGLAVGELFSDNGLGVLPNGNLIVASSLAIIYEIDINTGQIVLPDAGGYGGFDVTVLGPDVTPNGIVHRSTTNNLWVASENGDLIAEISTTGAAVTGPFTAFPAPAVPGDVEGLGFSPGFQSLLAADDTNDALVELSLTGGYIQTIDLVSLASGSGFLLDPEGVATDHATGRIFVANDDVNGQNILVFSTTGDVIDIVADQMTVFRGIQIGGTFADSFASDDSRLIFRPGLTLISSEAPVWLIFNGTLPSANPGLFEIVMEANAGTPGLTGAIEAWNWNSNAYDVVDVSAASFNTDAIVTVDLSANVANYVNQTTSAVRTRIGWRKTGLTLNFPWEVRLDQSIWRVN